MPVGSGLQSALNRHTVRLFTESDDTRGCDNAICPPENEQGTARNMLRIVMEHIQGVPGGMDKTSGECSLC